MIKIALQNINYRMSKLQMLKFRKLAGHILENNRFYKKKFAKAGIAKLTDLREKGIFYRIPLTSKNDLLTDQQGNPPYGLNSTARPKDYYYIQSSSGTSTGKTFFTPYSLTDFNKGMDVVIDMFKESGVKTGDSIYFVLPPGTATIAIDACRSIGAIGIPWNMYSNYQILQALQDSKATILWGTPSLMYNLINIANEKNFDLNKLSLRMVLIIAEIVTPEDCHFIEKQFGVTCRFNFGSTEFRAIGTGCESNNNDITYHLLERSLFFEIIDPKTGKHASRGEMVLTNLWRLDYPFIRYRTGNLVELVPGTCSCKNKQKRFRFLGRVDREIRFYTRYILPDQLETVLRKFPEVKNFSIELRKHLGLEFMYIKISPVSMKKADVSKRIKEEFIKQFDILPVIEIVPDAIYQQVYWKSKRFVDLRNESISLLHRDPEEPLQHYLHKISTIAHYRLIRPIVKFIFGELG